MHRNITRSGTNLTWPSDKRVTAVAYLPREVFVLNDGNADDTDDGDALPLLCPRYSKKRRWRKVFDLQKAQTYSIYFCV